VTPTQIANVGPAVVNSSIQSNQIISQFVTLQDRSGSFVSLGTTLIVPIDDSLVYVRPLYVSSSANPFPQLKQYIVVYGTKVSMETTLGAALADVFGPATSGIGGGSGQIPATVRALLASAQTYYNQGLAALKNTDLATYYDDMKMVGKLLAQAESELKKTAKSGATTSTAAPISGSSTTTTTTTTVPSQTGATAAVGPPATA